ncbi:hypothetical protein D6833_11960 [Candidatus Parcubacteria bacterium]|nr:MAG: hypothetical protein D6833_11960 [Candidatus Parcubacteria bacterium]
MSDRIEERVEASDEAWEKRRLGAEEAFVAVAGPEVEEAVDRAAGTNCSTPRRGVKGGGPPCRSR